MSANVESMFYVGRETPWHGLGKSVETAPSSTEAIILAGLDWNVVQSNVYTDDGHLAEGYKVNVRDTDRKVLGVVSDRYKIVQNSEAFSFTDNLLGEGVKYETAGSLAGGKRVWMLARMPQKTICDEKVDPFLVFTNTHDGTGAIQVAITPVRVVCQNTLNFALNTAERKWSCIHKGNIEAKLDEAKYTLNNANQYLESFEEEMGELKLHSLDDDKFNEYVKMLLPIEENDTQQKRNNVIHLQDDLRARYFNAPDLQDIEKSLYRFVNAVSDFATHVQPLRRTENYQQNLFMHTVDGNAMIDKAFNIAKCAIAA